MQRWVIGGYNQVVARVALGNVGLKSGGNHQLEVCKVLYLKKTNRILFNSIYLLQFFKKLELS